MMYDFSTLTDRRNQDSLKWDVEEHELPMWVADMDFQTAPEIIEALKHRVDHGIFGYQIVPDKFYEAIQDWWQKHHQIRFEKEWMMFCTGVVPAISSMIRSLTNVGENVLVQSPVYQIFYNSILNNGRHVLSNDLVIKEGHYEIDFQDLEQKLSDPQTTLMLLCNPHNPIGKRWDKETLQRIAELCATYHVIVIADEIHCDLCEPQHSYVPFANVSMVCKDIAITCVSASKAFNLAGLQAACIIVENDVLRHKVLRGINTDEVAEPNSFAVCATIAAFTKGEAWLNELRCYLQENKEQVYTFIKTKLPQLNVISSEATYLLWLDCAKIKPHAKDLVESIRKDTGLYITSGEEYGPNAKSFIRMNLACPRARLMDGCERLYQGVLSYQEKQKNNK